MKKRKKTRVSLKEWAKNFDIQDFRDDVSLGSGYGSVGRGSDARTVRDYCRDWSEHYDDLPVSLYLDGRPFWLGLAPVDRGFAWIRMWGNVVGWSPANLEDDWDEPYWPSAECDYVSPAWYGKRQRRWYRWNEKFDVSWLYQGKYMNPHGVFPSVDKFLERYMMWGDPIEKFRRNK